MGKNKRYKRKAKRILGDCLLFMDEYCSICIHDYNGNCDCIIANTGDIPRHSDIRTIERICKYGK